MVMAMPPIRLLFHFIIGPECRRLEIRRSYYHGHVREQSFDLSGHFIGPQHSEHYVTGPLSQSQEGVLCVLHKPRSYFFNDFVTNVLTRTCFSLISGKTPAFSLQRQASASQDITAAPSPYRFNSDGRLVHPIAEFFRSPPPPVPAAVGARVLNMDSSLIALMPWSKFPPPQHVLALVFQNRRKQVRFVNQFVMQSSAGLPS